MDIQTLRRDIDEIDKEIVSLFVRRMNIATQIANLKKADGIPILVPGREQEILDKVTAMSGTEYAIYTRALYTLIFQLSRIHQKMCCSTSDTSGVIE